MDRLFALGMALAFCLGGCGDGREELRELSSKVASCTTAADCCAVTDGCLSTVYVVGKGDYDKALGIARDLDDTTCTACITPVVDLRCVEGSCQGVALDPEEWTGRKGGREGYCGTVEDEKDEVNARTDDEEIGKKLAALSDSEGGKRILSCGDD